MMGIFHSLLVAISLCADCFAVSLCSSVTLRQIRWKEVLRVAVSFAVIQTGLLLIGWLFGSIFAGLIEKVSHIIGFLLLLYVGGSMILEGVKETEDVKDLNGWKNVILGGIATSIDAMAIGIAQSMESQLWSSIIPLLVCVFAVTMISVIAGIWGGKTLGSSCGRWAEIVGGCVLIGIGIGILI